MHPQSRDLLDRTGQLSEDQVVQALVGEAYELLDTPAKQVMQALAVCPGPVEARGRLPAPAGQPTIDAAPILTRLVRRQLARFQHGTTTCTGSTASTCAASSLPGARRSPGRITLSGLQARAADYYAQIRTPSESWRTLEDVGPQRAEIGLRCDTGNDDTPPLCGRHRIRLPAGAGPLPHLGRSARARPRTDPTPP